MITLIVVLIVPSLALPEDVAPSSSTSSRLHVIKPRNPQGLREFFKYTGESLHFVSAHRGGPQQGFPENCIATFENTLQHTFAIMEIDPRYSKDGAIVVHHDATLNRTTTGEGRVVAFTLSELKELRLRDTEGIVTKFQIPTLDEVLQWARSKTILVLDQKEVPVEARVRKIQKHQAEAYTMLIVYSFKDAKKCYELNKNVMMEVMIPNRERFHAFNETGVPWSNIIAFVGHAPPRDRELWKMIHAKGTCCMVGTSRNLDREFVAVVISGAAAVEQHYRTLLQRGADVIETDLPRKVGKLLYSKSAIPPSKSRFFQGPHY
ncbi:MAG: glycerophosphodiester phosphodiesterase family protein [Phycisphaerae bacterium]|nr:glycerophosphodiester phosphodiesterase family protein [Phycisphaerae bacterium]